MATHPGGLNGFKSGRRSSCRFVQTCLLSLHVTAQTREGGQGAKKSTKLATTRARSRLIQRTPTAAWNKLFVSTHWWSKGTYRGSAGMKTEASKCYCTRELCAAPLTLGDWSGIWHLAEGNFGPCACSITSEVKVIRWPIGVRQLLMLSHRSAAALSLLPYAGRLPAERLSL